MQKGVSTVYLVQHLTSDNTDDTKWIETRVGTARKTPIVWKKGAATPNRDDDLTDSRETELN